MTIGAGQYEIHIVHEYVDLPEFADGCRLDVALATLEGYRCSSAFSRERTARKSPAQWLGRRVV